MKRILILLAALIGAVAFTYDAAAAEKRNEQIESLWEEYEAASEKDYIQRMTRILDEIKVEALKERSAWDYYKAVCFSVKAKSAHNWKLAEELQAQAKKEIEAYDEPILDYLLRRESMSAEQKLAYLAEHADKLKSRRNADVHEGAGIIYPDVLLSTLNNDYQYILWDALTNSYRPSGEQCADIYELLSESLAGAYPQAGIAEFMYLKKIQDPENPAGMEEEFGTLAEKYKGKALGVMVNEHIVRLKLASGKDKGSSEYFRELRARAVKLIKERNSFISGSERVLAGCCVALDEMLEHLDAQVAYVTVKNADVRVVLKNLDKVKIRLSVQKDVVFDTLLHNRLKSYYTPDTLNFRLPDIADGKYKIECFSGFDRLGEYHFDKNTLSMSLRKDSQGTSVYVADYMTGEPVDCVDIVLRKGYEGRKVAEFKGLRLDGYTRLPEAIEKHLADYYSHTLECVARSDDGKERYISRYYSSREYAPAEETASRHSYILLDKPAYNPDEVLEFKAVIYERNARDGSMKVSSSGIYTVRLMDANGEVVSSKELRVNDFGSLVGEFPLKSLKRYGNCSIGVWQGDNMLGLMSFVVDEYVLPDFAVTFDKPERVYYSGCKVVVSGRLESFAGHPLSSAQVNAIVTLRGEVVSTSDVKVADDGSFEVSFDDIPDKGNTGREYSVEVKVTDLTGETHSYFFSQPVKVKPYVNCKLRNIAEGSCALYGSGIHVYVVDGIVASVACDAGYGHNMTCQGIPLEYKVFKDNVPVMHGARK